ncbi:MAG: outer membrane lipid asymmetry maintenance protein MlaD [Alphaproteobacteria bacterium]|nr:outer membrane lipid asymmetry maintenance protein MlaD [Alphaproteobacteria bacterium]
MGRSLVETVMGAVVLMIAGFFLVFAYNTSDLRPVEGYPILAKFNAVDGLEDGSDVRMGGVKVGSVTDARIDPMDYRAVVTMSIQSELKLPTDTTASVSSDGLLGGKYVELKPGNAAETIPTGGEIGRTEDVVDIEALLSKAIFLLSEEVTK